MYLEIFLVDFEVFRVFGGILRDFAEIPEFRGSATARNIRSPDYKTKPLIQDKSTFRIIVIGDIGPVSSLQLQCNDMLILYKE